MSPPSDVSALGASADATPIADSSGICPGPEKPGPDTFVGDVPMPAGAPCDSGAPAFFKGTPPPAKSLPIELGRVDNTGKFIPYEDGGWIAMEHGVQGGMHVWVAARVTLPGKTDPKLKIQTETLLTSGCSQAGYSPSPVVYASSQPDGTYVVGSASSPGIQVFVGTGTDGSAAKFCNKWYDVHVACRLMLATGGFGPWGTASVRMRSYDMKNVQ